MSDTENTEFLAAEAGCCPRLVLSVCPTCPGLDSGLRTLKCQISYHTTLPRAGGWENKLVMSDWSLVTTRRRNETEIVFKKIRNGMSKNSYKDLPTKTCSGSH